MLETGHPILTELTLADHVRHLDPLQGRVSRMEGAEALDWARQALNGTVILLDDVVEIFALTDFNLLPRPGESEPCILPLQASQIAAALVDNNLLRHTV